MKLLSFKNKEGNIKLGFLQDQKIVDMECFGVEIGTKLPNNMLDIIDMGIAFIPKLNRLIKEANEESINKHAYTHDEIKIVAPIPRPRKNIIGIGLNYTEHVAESARTLDTSKELPQKPVIFCKPTTAVIGPGDEVLLNRKLTQQLDYESELAVVIGKEGKYVKPEEALDYVYGYTVINDVSARDCRRSGQWIVSKGQDTFAPMGPYLVTKDEISDPHNLNISFKLNGEERQNGNTKYMLFNINALLEDISTVFRLEPGDIIATGTPAGVGAGRDPQEWMKDGDVMESTVEGIGTLINTVREIKFT